MLRIHAIVCGRVQAVGFRYFSNQLAHHYNLTGWVKNLYDGTVEMEIQGTTTNIENFLMALKKGNGYSKVSNVRTDEIQLISNEFKFVIIH